MTSSSPPPPPSDAKVDAPAAPIDEAVAPSVSDLKAGSGRKREREGSMEPSDKMSALKLAALGQKKVKEAESAASSSSKDRLSKSPPSATAALQPPTVPSTAEASSSAPASAAAPSAKPKAPTFSSFTSSGFGSAASSGGSNAFSAFATAKPFGSAGASTSAGASSSSFGDILSKGGRGTTAEADGSKEDGKDGSAADEAEADVAGDDGVDGIVKLAAQDTITGEEDEDTRHQVRCKLYVLEKEGGWKERGTGIFKVNVNVESAKPRLLMRADGVLRLILNVALFPGMSCERQDKWVRFSAFEDAQLAHLAVRAGSVKAAEELFDKIQALMPPDGMSRLASASKSPEAPAAPAAASKPALVHSKSTEVTFKDEPEPKPDDDTPPAAPPSAA